MNKPSQQEMMQLLSKVWAKHPELRLGQLIENAAKQKIVDPDIFYISDDELFMGLIALDEWLSNTGCNEQKLNPCIDCPSKTTSFSPPYKRTCFCDALNRHLNDLQIEHEKEILELKRIRGICCPEPTCNYKRETYTTCEGCEASCTVCIHNPTNREKNTNEGN